MSTKSLIRIAAFAGLALCLSGCLVIPIPRAGWKVTEGWKAQATRLQAASATRQQVTNQLGPPAWEFPELRVLGHQWSGVEFSGLWVAGGMGGAGGGYCEPTIHRLLWLYFDDQERLAHWKLTSVPQPETRTTWESARRWRETLRPPPPAAPKRSESASPPPGKALVHVLWDKGSAVTGVKSVKVDGQASAELRKGAFTTLALESGPHMIGILSETLALDLAGGEVCFLSFRPDKQAIAKGAALARCPEPEAVKRLDHLSFCK